MTTTPIDLFPVSQLQCETDTGIETVPLAEEIDLGGDHVALGIGHAQVTDVGQQPMATGFELHLAAHLPRHGDAWIGFAGQLPQAPAAHLDAGAAAGHVEDRADRLVPG